MSTPGGRSPSVFSPGGGQVPVGDVRFPGPYFSSNIPIMPASAWSRMWQWNIHMPGRSS